MKLYMGQGPNPFRVHAFLLEKCINDADLGIERIEISFEKGEHKSPGFLKVNSLGQIPVLELDDGTIITESMAICRYFDGLSPEVPLFGSTPKEQAVIEMWQRRAENEILANIGGIAFHSDPFFKDRVIQVPEYAIAQRELMPRKLKWFDNELSDGRPYLAGENFSVADITGMAALMVASFFEVDVPASLEHMQRWSANITKRPSWPF